MDGMTSVWSGMVKIYRWRIVAAAVFLGLGLTGCAKESVLEAYRDSSDWLNDVPEPPPDDPWRLSKQIEGGRLPYPNLGDVPDRPKDTPTAAETARKIRELERNGAALAVNKPQEGPKDAISLGAPSPVRMAPLVIPDAEGPDPEGPDPKGAEAEGAEAGAHIN